MLFSDDENLQLRNEVEVLKNELQTLENVNIGQQKCRKRRNEDMMIKLGDEIEEREEGFLCKHSAKYKNNEAKRQGLRAEKVILEDKVRNCSIADERLKKILQLTDESLRLSKGISKLQERFDKCSSEKIELENELQRKIYELQAKEIDLTDLRIRVKESEVKAENREQEIAILRQKLRLCNRGYEIAVLEKRKSEDDICYSNKSTPELENQINQHRVTIGKCKKEMKRQEDEILELENANKILRSRLEEMAQEKNTLRAKLDISESKTAKLDKELGEAQEKISKLEDELQRKNKHSHDIERTISMIENKAVKMEKENEISVHKVHEASNLIAEFKEVSKSKMAELQKFFEDYKCTLQRESALQHKLDEREKALEASEQKIKQQLENSRKTIRKQKEAVKYLQKANESCKTKIYSLEVQHDKLQQDGQGIENENVALKKVVTAMEVELKIRNQEITGYQEKIQGYLAKIEEDEGIKRTLKQSYQNEITSMKAEIEKKDKQINEASVLESDLYNKLTNVKAECEMYKNEVEKLKETNENNDYLILTGKGNIQALTDNKTELISRLKEHEKQLVDSKNREQELIGQLTAAREGLEKMKTEKKNLYNDCEQLSKANQESYCHLSRLESNIEVYNERIAILEEANAKLESEKQSIEVGAKYTEKEQIRLCRKENELKQEMAVKDKEIIKVKKELEKKRKSIQSLRHQLKKIVQMCKNLRNDLKTVSDQNNTKDRALKEVEVKLQCTTGELEVAEQATAELKSKVEKMNELQEELKEKYNNGQDEIKISEESIKELREYVVKLEQENEDLNRRSNSSLNGKKIEEANINKFYKEEKSMGQEEQIEMLKRDLRKREEDFESLGQEYQNLSKEMVNIKVMYSKMLKDHLNQNYEIEELSGSHEYEQNKRKKLQNEAGEKDKELITLRKKLTAIIELFDKEREVRLKADTGMRRFKALYEEVAKEKASLIDNKESMEKEMQKQISKLQHNLQAERSSSKKVGMELDRRRRDTGNYLRELEVQKNVIDTMGRKIKVLENSLSHKAEQNKELEKRLQEKMEKIDQFVEIVDKHKNEVICRESNLESMTLKLKKKDHEKYELEQALISKEKENSALEKEKAVLKKRTHLLEDSIREADRRYKVQWNEERELKEDLKNVWCEYKKLLEEKGVAEEMRHLLELKLLQSGEGHNSAVRSKEMDLQEKIYLIENEPNCASTEVKQVYEVNENMMKQGVDEQSESFHSGTIEDLADFPSIFDDEKVNDFHGIRRKFNENNKDTRDEKFMEVFESNIEHAK